MRVEHNTSCPHLRMAVPFWNRVTSAIVSGISARRSHLSSVYATIPCSSPGDKTNTLSENQQTVSYLAMLEFGKQEDQVAESVYRTRYRENDTSTVIRFIP